MGMRSVLRRFDQVFGLRRSCSEEWSVWGGCGVLDWTLGLPCSPLSRLISSRRRWFSAWAARRSAITSSSTLSSRLTSSRACSSTMLCRSRSSSIVPLAPVARGGVYGEPLCQIPSVVATRQGMGFQPPIFEMIQYLTTVKDSADALLRLLNDILDFSKIEAAKLDLESLP